MIVQSPKLTIDNGKVCIAARFEMQNPVPFFPKELWYRFPEQFAEKINHKVDAFAPTALLVAMYAGEDIIVRGPISPRLAYNLYEYCNIYHSWNPKLFKRINITYELLELPPQSNHKAGVVTAFSGGVDSFYTLWAHLPQNQPIPDAQITHGLFVHGLDLRLDDEANYKAAAEPYKRMFEELGLELIQSATNAYQFSEFRINWTLFFGAPTIGAALILTPWLGRFYMPSGMTSHRNLFPQGSSPIIDHLLSTETTEIIHHGASVSRYDKLSILAQWPATYHQLRVCSNKRDMAGFQNCSKCHKCYRTIVLLDLLKALPHYTNFSQKMTPVDYVRWGALTHLNTVLAKTIRNQAITHGRLGMAFWIQIAIMLRAISKTAVELGKKLFSNDQLYRLKRIFYQLETDPTQINK